MSLTNAQLVRLEAGDAGTPVRDVSSGDAASTVFYLSAPPLVGNSQVVTVGGAARTEVPTAPGATEYTIDDETGKVVFGAAPGAGTDNIVITYKAVAVTDAAIAEACRQFSLTDTATAETNAPAALLEAAAMVCDWRAADAAQDYDFDTDGQSFKRGSAAGHWADRAKAIRVRLNQQFGITSVPMTRLDGYSRKGEYSTRDIGTTSQNPRRNYYGQPDVIP